MNVFRTRWTVASLILILAVICTTMFAKQTAAREVEGHVALETYTQSHPRVLNNNYYLPWTAGQAFSISRAGGDHGNAIDIPMPIGTAILATADGHIQKITDHHTQTGCSYPNNLVEIKHGNGDVSHYLHINTNSVPDHLQVGSFIPRGTLIARGGNIGCSTGPHLHFQIQRGSGLINPYFTDIGGYVVTGGTYTSGNHAPTFLTKIDQPGSGATVSGVVRIEGWAIHQGMPNGTGIDRVDVWLEQGNQFIGTATYGLQRGDVVNAYGERFRYSGYAIDWNTNGLASGTYKILVTTRSTAGEWSPFPKSVTVNVAAPTAPVGYIDVRQNTTVTGNARIHGWAKVDPPTASIDRIEVWIDGKKKEDAVYGFSRPDAGGNVGWEYRWDTYSASNGAHEIKVKAVTSAGAEAWLITTGDHTTARTITVNNKYLLGDVTGDGKADLVRVAADGIFVRISDGTRFLTEQTWSAADARGYQGQFVADVTGDGYADVIAVKFDKVYVYRSSGVNFLPAEPWTPKQYFGILSNPFADVTGDGKADAIVVNNEQNNDRVTVRASNGMTFTENIDWTEKQYFGQLGNFYTDVTGDGKADAIVVNYNHITVRRSDGSWFQPNENWSGGHFSGQIGTFFADVTGDGKADAIAVDSAGLKIRRANLAGTAFESTVETWTTTPMYGEEGIFFTDVTGDGKADAIISTNNGTFVRRSNGTSFGDLEYWDREGELPPTNCGLSINNAAAFTNNLSVTLNLQADQAADMLLSNDGGFASATWNTYTSTPNWTLNDPGQRIATLLVYARVRDTTGAALCNGGTLIDDIVYDPLAPDLQGIAATATGARSTNTSMILHITAHDQIGGSGVAEMRIQSTTTDTGWIAYTEDYAFQAEAGAVLTVHVKDSAGNLSEPMDYTFVPSYSLYLPTIQR